MKSLQSSYSIARVRDIALLLESASHYFLCVGSGDGISPLNAFDRALLDAGVGDVNLVRLSSILPPGCEQIEPFSLPGGALVPTAYARAQSSQPGERIAAAVAIAIAKDPQMPGVIMEHHGVGTSEEVCARVREMALESMRVRRRAVADVICIGAEHQVQRHGAAFAGVVLCNGAGQQPSGPMR